MGTVAVNSTLWQYQAPLKLSVGQWKTLLLCDDIFDQDAMTMLYFVYHQPNHQSSATEIGLALGGVTQQKVTALNREISKRIYRHLKQTPPANSEGGKRY